MNIYFLDKDPVKSAQQLCDRHLNRQVQELGQLLSHTMHRLGSKDYRLYKPLAALPKFNALKNWLYSSLANFKWTLDLFNAVSEEYTYRFGKVHKTWTKLNPVFTEWTSSGQALISYHYSLTRVTTYRKQVFSDKAEFYPPPQCVGKTKVCRGRRLRIYPYTELDQYQELATIMAYRRFYLHYNVESKKWTKREPPAWFTNKNYWDIMNKMLEIEKRCESKLTWIRRSIDEKSGEPDYYNNFLIERYPQSRTHGFYRTLTRTQPPQAPFQPAPRMPFNFNNIILNPARTIMIHNMI